MFGPDGGLDPTEVWFPVSGSGSVLNGSGSVLSATDVPPNLKQ